jgi:chromosome partitioning protein
VSQIIAIFNQAGGVGKSTLTMNLGYELGQRGHRVLLVDMDPQGSLTLFMGLEPHELEKTIYGSLMDDESLAVHSVHGIDLVPANIDLSGAEIGLVMADMRDTRLKVALQEARKDYDFILIDCPPSLGLLSYLSLVAADQVLVPIQTEFKAFRGTGLLLSTVGRVKKRANAKLKICGFIPTLYDARKSQHKRAYQAIQEQLSEVAPVLAPVSDATAWSDAAEARQPLALYSPNHAALTAFAEVISHVEAQK